MTKTDIFAMCRIRPHGSRCGTERKRYPINADRQTLPRAMPEDIFFNKLSWYAKEPSDSGPMCWGSSGEHGHHAWVQGHA